MLTLYKIFKKWCCSQVGQGSGLKIHPCRFDSYWHHWSGSSPDGSPTAVGLSQRLITFQGVVIYDESERDYLETDWNRSANVHEQLSSFFKNFISLNFIRSAHQALQQYIVVLSCVSVASVPEAIEHNVLRLPVRFALACVWKMAGRCC